MTARASGLVGCRHCARVWPASWRRCGRCGARLISRDAQSLGRVWAWWVTGAICYVPALLFPMLETRTLFGAQSNTIIGGALELWAHGAWPVALVILVASVLIPLGKFAAIGWLALAVGRGWPGSRHRRMQLYELVEFIGRWSMIDVFVVAILSALVQLGVLVRIAPGPAAAAFALSVVMTMLAARSFDSRLIWDSLEPRQ